MTADPVRDAARQLADDAGPPGPQQQSVIASQIGPHMDAQDTAGDTAA